MSRSAPRTNQNQTTENSVTNHQSTFNRTPFFNSQQNFLQPDGIIQRRCEECEKKAVQKQPVEEEELRMQRDELAPSQRVGKPVAQAIESQKGKGRALSIDVRNEMETHLGQDLSGVRVHTGRSAHQLNKSVNARAFTTGNDLFFKKGAYNPVSSSGRELLAHELTHVIQQRSGTSGLQSGEISHPSDPAEKEAEAVGKAVRHSKGEATIALARQKHRTFDDTPVIRRGKEGVFQNNFNKKVNAVVKNSSKLRISRNDDGPEAYEQKYIFYNIHEKDESIIPRTETNWGTNVIVDDSYFKNLRERGPIGFYPYQRHGVGFMDLMEFFKDWRDAALLDDQFLPVVDAKVRWQQRSGEEPLTNIAGTLDYDPGGGGGMRIDVLYNYGGFVEEGGKKKGQHNILLNFTYDSQMTQSSGIEFGGEFSGRAGGISASASSSVSVSMSALRFSREIAFETYSYD